MSSDRSGTRAIRLRASGVLLVVLVTCVLAGREFAGMWTPDEFHPSKGLFRRGNLSDYFPSLRNTRADASLYLYAGERPGPTVLVLGGTHPNEPAGFMAATVLLENALVRAGRLIVVPQACLSGFTCTDPLEGTPSRFTLATPSGERSFRFGSRGANVVDQWPDPLVYLHHPSGQKLSGNETRNLNRAYPGRADGSLTEQAAFAIMVLIERESVRVAIDLHEAAPEIPIINAIVAHEKGREIAAEAVLDLELRDLQYALELSPPNFHGLSHREWGDRTEATPFLMETSNPIQGRLRGKTTVDLLVSGRDGWYAQAVALGTMRIAYALEGESLSKRVGRHLEGFRALVEAYNAQHPAEPFAIEGVPGYHEMTQQGIGAWLR
jgi:hypothetical protein